uniref:RRM domain-containing protein n=1 Tax=Leersia perrieri TaxID=77586 RepID=A0A0D9W653_9ORYZ
MGDRFKGTFTGEGLRLLRERVREKLKELMGDYSDDTLVEYVVVLVRNGRRKDEAAKELEVFLSDNNDAFISWLWDHLSSSLHLYVQPKAISTSAETKGTSSNARGMHVHDMTSSTQVVREPVAGIQKTTGIQQRREWGGIVREQSEAVPLRSVVNTVSQAEEKDVRRSHARRRTHSPDTHHHHHQHRKRSREDDEHQIKRTTSQQAHDAPRRLIQFAVRDAVRTVQPITSRSESASKRLRSVVSTMASDAPLDVGLQKTNLDVRVPGATAAAFRAAAEAAEDALKEKYTGSVFRRLGRRGILNAAEESFGYREQDPEREYVDIDNVHAENQLDFHERSHYAGDAYMYDREAPKAVDSASDINGFDDAGAARYNDLIPYRSTLPSSVGKESLVVGFNTVDGAAKSRSRRSIMQDAPASSGSKPSERMLDISVNSITQTHKSANHETRRNAVKVEPRVPTELRGVDSRKSNATLAHVNNTPMTDKSKDLKRSSSVVEAQKVSSLAVGSCTTGQPEGGTDSRTIFVTNVHFAATKDALSRHFNKFGAVLKTLIVTDVSGQPTGSAYIEFLLKESAEQALTLNGTSFMSRILKVIRRNSAEVPQLPGWSRASRGSPFASRLTRTAYPRSAFPGATRGRLPLRGGARSLQWKREDADTVDAGKSSNSIPIPTGNQLVSPVARSFTYTRAEPNQDIGATI